MSVCLISTFFYFLLPGPIGCATDAEIATRDAQEQSDVRYNELVREVFSPAKCRVSSSYTLPQLNDKESCMVSSLSSRCNDADDCLVQCIARGLNRSGDGCWHLCFETVFSLPEWSKPKGFEACSKLGGHNGS